MKKAGLKIFIIFNIFIFISACNDINDKTVFTKNEIKNIGCQISGMCNFGRLRPGIWGTRGQMYGNSWDYEGKLLPLYYYKKWGIKRINGKDEEFLLKLSSREDDYLHNLSKMNMELAEQQKFELTDYYRAYHYNHFLYSFTFQRYFLLNEMNKQMEMDSLEKSLTAYNSKRRWNKALYNDAIYISILSKQYLRTGKGELLERIEERLIDAKNKVLDKRQAQYEVHEPERITYLNTRLANSCAIILNSVEGIKEYLDFKDYIVFKKFIENYLNHTELLEITHWIRNLNSFNGIDYMAPTDIVEYIIERYNDKNRKPAILNQILYLLWRYQYDDGTWYVYRCTLTTVKCLDILNTILIKGDSLINKVNKDCGIESRNKALQWLDKNYRNQINSYPVLSTLGGMEKLLTKYELLCLLRIYDITKDETLRESISLALYGFIEKFWKKQAHALEEASQNKYYQKELPREIGNEWAFPYSEILGLAYKVFKNDPERYLYQRCMENMYDYNSISIVQGWYELNENWAKIEKEEDLWRAVNSIKIIAQIRDVVQMDAKIKAMEAAKKVINIIEKKITKYKSDGEFAFLDEYITKNDSIIGDSTGLGYFESNYQFYEVVLEAIHGIHSLNKGIGLNDLNINESIIRIMGMIIEDFTVMEKEINNNPHYKGRYLCDLENRVEAVALLYKIAKHYNEFDNYTINLGKRMKEEILAEKAYKHPIYHGRELVYGIGGPMLYAILAE